MDENCWPLILDAATGFTDQYDEPDGVPYRTNILPITYSLSSSPSTNSTWFSSRASSKQQSPVESLFSMKLDTDETNTSPTSTTTNGSASSEQRSELEQQTLKPHYLCLHTGCAQSFSQEVDLEAHYRSHDPVLSPTKLQYTSIATGKGAKYRCLAPGCTYEKGFKRLSDLKRHQKKHSRAVPRWSCGCCMNVNPQHVYRTHRKDHMAQHLRKIHYSLNRSFPCPSGPCHRDTELCFSSAACVEVHLRQNHSTTDLNTLDNINDGPKQQSSINLCSDDPAMDTLYMNLESELACQCERMAGRTAMKCGKEQVSTTAAEIGQDMGSTENTLADTGSDDSNSQMVLHSFHSYSQAQNLMPSITGVGSLFNGSFSPHPHILGFDYHFGASPLPEMDLGVHLSNPYAECGLTTAAIDQAARVVAQNVHPADFLILLNCYHSLESVSMNSMNYTETVPYASISYNPCTRIVKARGSSRAIEFAKVELEEKFRYALAHPTTIAERNTCKQLENIFGNLYSLPQISNDRNDSRRDADRTFTIRANEDREVVSLWGTCILPALPDILNDRVGKEYTASLLRRGSCKEQASAFIQIQVPWLPIKVVRKDVRKLVSQLFLTNRQVPIPIRFSEGRMTFLLGSCPGEESDTEDDESIQFPYFQRFWERLGMGGSIGPLSTRQVSATAGGYVLVKGIPYMLTVKHFMPSEHETTITSPSLADLDYVRGHLEQNLRNVRAKIDNNALSFGNHDMSPEEFESSLSPEDRTCFDICTRLRVLLDEVNRNEQEYVLGEIVYKCMSDTRRSLGSYPLPQSNPPAVDEIRMDWALCQVASGRVGENRHRYGEGDIPGELDFSRESPQGRGNICAGMSDIEPNSNVYYVGRKSGRRHGEINGTLTLVSKDGISTKEWSIVCPGKEISEAECTGDSGAWVLNYNNTVTAQVYGYSAGNILVSSIKEIFEDIKEVARTPNVCLPQDPTPRHPARGYSEISEKHTDKPRKPKGFNIKSLPAVSTNVSPLRVLAQLDPPFAQLDPHFKLVGTQPQSMSKSRPIQEYCNPSPEVECPVSPVPSLASSKSISPEPDALTPPASHDAIALYPRKTPSPSLFPSIEAQISLSSDKDDSSGLVQVVQESERSARLLSLDPEPSPAEGITHRFNKHSIDYLLCATPSGGHPIATNGHPRQSNLRLKRKASTFPVFKKRLQTRTLSLNLCGLSLLEQALPIAVA